MSKKQENQLNFFTQLQAATSEDERNWLVTKRLLDAMPDDLRQLVFAATIPHWFDIELLMALLPHLKRRINPLFETLQNQSFIEPFQGHGYNIHELPRRLILKYLWTEQKTQFRNFSLLASEYFQKISDPSAITERIYHLLIAFPENGTNALRDQGLEWHDKLQSGSYPHLNALGRITREHFEGGRLDGRGVGWGLFFEALVHSYEYRLNESKIIFKQAISYSYSDEQLKANSIKLLGDVQVRLSELQEAQEHYLEALPIFKSINDPLGEANCLKSIGDVYVLLSDIDEAQKRYKEALNAFRSINNLLGEANCIKAIGDLHLRLAELKPAQKSYEEALSKYQSIENKLGEGNCILALGKVQLRFSNNFQAKKLFENSLTLFRLSGSKLGQANSINALGKLAYEENDLTSAKELLGEAKSLFDLIGIANTLEIDEVTINLGRLSLRLDEATIIYGRKSPGTLSLLELNDLCMQETNNFRDRQAEDTWHCYEIFRRAVVMGSDEARKVIFAQYQNQVKGWVEHHPRFQDFQMTTEFFVNQVFEKFWRRNFSAIEFAQFPNLRAILAYLKACAGSVMTNYWYHFKEKSEVVYLDDIVLQESPGFSFSYQDNVLNQIEQDEFWNELRIQMNDEQAFYVLYASFVLNLKPVDIFNQLPNHYSDVQEIYKIKAKAINNLSRVLLKMGLLSNLGDAP